MPVDFDLLELMPDTVLIAPRTGKTAYSTPVYGTATPVQARVEKKPRMIRTMDGREVVSSARVTLAVPIDVSAEDRITLPDGTTPPILSVESSPDQSGPYCVQINV